MIDPEKHLPASFHDRLGLIPRRTLHDKGATLLYDCTLVQQNDPAPEGLRYWTDIKLKTGEGALGEPRHTRTIDYPGEPDDSGWAWVRSPKPIYETMQVFSHQDFLLKFKYQRELVWRRWTENDRDLGIKAPRHLRPYDVRISRIDSLPCNRDFTEQIKLTEMRTSISEGKDETRVYAHQLNVGDLVEIDITALIEKQGEVVGG